jgi:hypothetical protein
MTLAVPRATAQQPLPSQPPPASAQAPDGESVAPLKEGTQQTYVPESVALSGPRIITSDEDDQHVPPGYHVETRIRKGLVITGAAVFGGLYVLSFLTAASIHANNGYNDDGTRSTRNDDGAFLFVPIVGPFLQMTKTDTAWANVFLAIDGAAQAGGALMFILGMASPKTVLVRNDLAEVHVLPMTVGTGGGAGLSGRF